MISIIDYGLGNILSFVNVYNRLNIKCSIAKTPEDLLNASKIILPGVGSFDQAMERLDASGLRPTLDDLVLQKGIPILGICVGMQILANTSEEGTSKGLGWIEGSVKKFDVSLTKKIPHMGWNDVVSDTDNHLFDGLKTQAKFYFLHSFYYECADKKNALAIASYGEEFCCAIHKENIYGVQFHPEKSHHFGTRLLKNFSEI